MITNIWVNFTWLISYFKTSNTSEVFWCFAPGPPPPIIIGFWTRPPQIPLSWKKKSYKPTFISIIANHILYVISFPTYVDYVKWGQCLETMIYVKPANFPIVIPLKKLSICALLVVDNAILSLRIQTTTFIKTQW